VVQSGQGADEILAGYDWYPLLGGVARDQTTVAYAKVLFDRGHADVLALLSPEYGVSGKTRACGSSPRIRRRRGPAPPSTRRRGWTPP
jgi:asparagine synthetase B (glutamine-hydrolysing)